eukprot:gene3572-biopygen3564
MRKADRRKRNCGNYRDYASLFLETTQDGPRLAPAGQGQHAPRPDPGLPLRPPPATPPPLQPCGPATPGLGDCDLRPEGDCDLRPATCDPCAPPLPATLQFWGSAWLPACLA